MAVLPFLDLTDKMAQEPFADGMTEELIDKLSKIPLGLLGTASHVLVLFQGQTLALFPWEPATTIADIAKHARCRLRTRWERAQIRCSAPGCCAPDSCGQWVRCLV